MSIFGNKEKEENHSEEKWFKNTASVGICGATSTPRWLMDEVADYISNIC